MFFSYSRNQFSALDVHTHPKLHFSAKPICIIIYSNSSNTCLCATVSAGKSYSEDHITYSTNSGQRQ